MNELDEYAIEEGLRLAEAHGGEVTILTMGPERAERVDPQGAVDGRRQGRAPDRRRPGRVGRAWPPRRRSPRVLSRIGFDVVILGSESTDARMGVMAAMLAERLGVPQLSYASKVEIDGTAIVASTARPTTATTGSRPPCPR